MTEGKVQGKLTLNRRYPIGVILSSTKNYKVRFKLRSPLLSLIRRGKKGVLSSIS